MLLLKFREKKTVVRHHKPSPATLPLRLSDARVVAHSSQYSSHLGTIQSLTWEHAIETVPRSCQLAHKRITAPGQGVVPLRLQQPTAPPAPHCHSSTALLYTLHPHRSHHGRQSTSSVTHMRPQTPMTTLAASGAATAAIPVANTMKIPIHARLMQPWILRLSDTRTTGVSSSHGHGAVSNVRVPHTNICVLFVHSLCTRRRPSAA